jgi:bifunctional lysine-specific demethylase and histidyl-hydroxylase NO66
MTAKPSTSTDISDLERELASRGRWPSLSRCVADPEDFMATYWSVRPYFDEGDESRFAETFTLGEFDRILATGALGNVSGIRPRIRMIKNGEKMPDAAFSKTHGPRSRPGLAWSIDCERVARLLRIGGTLIVEAIDEGATGLSELCAGLESELTHHIHANLYLTPPDARGFDAHYDPHDVIILQISGVKHWRVFEPVPDRLAKPRVVTVDPGARPVIDTILTPGDTLYIPRAWVHIANTANDASLHITVGITHASVHDLLTSALSNLELRRLLDTPLPTGFSRNPMVVAEALAGAPEVLTRALSDPDTARYLAEEFTRTWRAEERRNRSGLIVDTIEKLRNR